jgi:hypothetical protein
MKIKTYNIWNDCHRTMSKQYLLKFKFQKRWNGKLIYVGLVAFGIIIDLRGINNIYDFKNALLNR